MVGNRRPDFLIVGAPKCGTTALSRYLTDHPQIHVASRKDLHFFGSDLGFTQRKRLSGAEYLEHFSPAKTSLRVGEASVWYLYSKVAAAEIAGFDPCMKIIIMLRNPVDMMHALYTQLRFNGLGDEDLDRFEDALEAESARAEGRCLPPQTPLREGLLYRRVAKFSEQIMRYKRYFPADQICFVLHSDLRSDTPGVYRNVLEFLGVDTEFTPEFPVVNSSKVTRSEGLRKIVSSVPSWLKDSIPNPLRLAVRSRFRHWNTVHQSRPRLSPQLRQRLLREFHPEVTAVSALINRDLSHWLE